MRWLWIVLLSGCALTSKSKPIEMRYFAPVVTAPVKGSPPIAGPAPAIGEQKLRLGRVEGASYLRAKIAYRESRHEVGYYETRRWTEEPAEYVRRALSRAFFEERGLAEVVSGTAPTLEIELSAFDEVRGARPSARIEVTWKLRNGRDVIAQRTLEVSRPMVGKDADDLAVAMGGALDEVVDAVVGDVISELGRVPAAE
jgi:cholesterol transport system auxiliary component